MTFMEAVSIAAISFLLTTIIGSVWTAKWQKVNWNHQKKETDRSSRKAERRRVFEEVVTMTGRRLYRMRRLQAALRSGDAKKAEEKLLDYDKSLYDWNENITKIYALIQIYFGKELRDEFERNIVKDILHVGMLLERRYRNGAFCFTNANI